MASNSSSTLEKLKSFIASPCSSQDFEVESLQNEESAELVSIIIINFGIVFGNFFDTLIGFLLIDDELFISS